MTKVVIIDIFGGIKKSNHAKKGADTGNRSGDVRRGLDDERLAVSGEDSGERSGPDRSIFEAARPLLARIPGTTND